MRIIANLLYPPDRLALLRDRGKVVTVHGRGTYVTLRAQRLIPPSRVQGAPGPLSVCDLPVGVAVRGAFEYQWGWPDLRFGRLQDASLSLPGQGGKAWPRSR